MLQRAFCMPEMLYSLQSGLDLLQRTDLIWKVVDFNRKCLLSLSFLFYHFEYEKFDQGWLCTWDFIEGKKEEKKKFLYSVVLEY